MRLLRVILLPLACAISQAQDAGLVIGSIGGIEMRKDEILESLGGLGTVEKEALARDPAALNKLLRSMLVQRVIYQQAVEVKWDQEPAIQPLIKSTREAAITDSYLKHISRPPEGYPDETELRKAYEVSRAELTVPRSFRLAQIFITAGSDQQLAEVKKRLKADPAGFGRIAREMSEEKESAAREGEIGWLTERQVQPEIFEQLPKLSLNVVSEPVRLKDGWHILKVLDVREPFTPIFDQVRVQLAQRLRAEKIRVGMQAYVAETLQKHPVAINEVALSKLLQEVPTRDSALKP
jgi:peptidylprolyl isomerase